MRSLWKIKRIKKYFYKSINKKKKKIIIKSKDAVIIGPWIGKFISVYDGKTFNKISITSSHVGYKVGEFICTRKHTKSVLKESDRKKLKNSQI